MNFFVVLMEVKNYKNDLLKVDRYLLLSRDNPLEHTKKDFFFKLKIILDKGNEAKF